MRVTSSVLTVMLALILACSMSRFSHRKRKTSQGTASSALNSLQVQVEFLTGRLARLVSPSLPAGGFMLDGGASEYQRAIDWCWAGDFSDCRSEVLRANPDLEEFLHERTLNSYSARNLPESDTAQNKPSQPHHATCIIVWLQGTYRLPGRTARTHSNSRQSAR